MTPEQTREAIKVMQHFADGGKVESRLRNSACGWGSQPSPIWCWNDCEYRIARAPLRTWVIVDRDGDPLDHTFHYQYQAAAEDFAERRNREKGPVAPYRVVEMVEATT